MEVGGRTNMLAAGGFETLDTPKRDDYLSAHISTRPE